MAPIVPITARGLVALHGTERFFDHNLNLNYHHHSHNLSGSGQYVPVHHTTLHNCTELGLAKLDCCSKIIGIAGLSRSQGVASSSTSRLAGPSFSYLPSTPISIDGAVKKAQSRDQDDDEVEEEPPRPRKGLWFLAILEIIVGSALVLWVLAGLAAGLATFVVSQVKQKFREQRKRRKVEDENRNMLRQRAARLSGDTNLTLPARPISHINPLLPGIGVAGAPRDDVFVADEHVERGRPQERFWKYEPRNPRIGLASSSTAVGRNEINVASQIPSPDNSEASDIGVVDMGAERGKTGYICGLWNLFLRPSDLSRRESKKSVSAKTRGLSNGTT
ncbi:hypothetical protein MMC07_000174 [Pseudocyphellaria aurata]|nr:hypothetical protein [Pseudocyphellaria aurata]